MRKVLFAKRLLAFCFIFLISLVSNATDYYVSTTGNDGIGDGSVGNPWATIQFAVNSVVNGDVIHVAAGTYAENVTVNKWLTIVGVGNTTIIQPSITNPGISLNSPGTNSAQRVIIKNLKITGAIGGSNPGSGIAIPSGLGYITIDGVSSIFNSGNGIVFNHTATLTDIIIKNCDLSNNGNDGIRIATSLVSLNGLQILSSHLDGNGVGLASNSGAGIGMEIYTASASHPNASVVDPTRLVTNVLIQQCSFINNLTKAFYAERLDNATLDQLDIENNGVTGTTSPAGIDLNLKFNAFQNITLQNIYAIGNAPTSAAFYLKARNDGTTYGSNPASLTGLTLLNNEVTASKYGIVLENNVTNPLNPTTPIQVHYNSIHNNSTAGLVNNVDGQPLVNATCNWWGSTSGPANASNPGGAGNAVVGNANFAPWLISGTDADESTIGFQTTSPCTGGLRVHDITNHTDYVTIQQGVDGANAGDLILVDPGTYNENVTVSKSLTLKGSNFGVSCSGGRSTETVVNGTGNSGTATFKVNSDGVTIDGFTITNHNGSFGISESGRSNLDFEHNIITDIGNTTTGSQSSFGIDIEAGITNNSSQITASNNCINNIRGGANTSLSGPTAKSNNGSSGGLFIGSTTDTKLITNLVIQSNIINQITASTTDFNDGGKGAYGILVDNGVKNSTGQASGVIQYNEISVIEGLWAHGIGLEGRTPGMGVLNNIINNLTDHKGNTDAIGILLQDNDRASTVQIHNNSLTNMAYAIAVDPANPDQGSIAASCNWYGTVNGTIIATKIVGNVMYIPWLNSGVDGSTDTGFQPSGTCSGNPNDWDGDGVPNGFDCDPSNPNIGAHPSFSFDIGGNHVDNFTNANTTSVILCDGGQYSVSNIHQSTSVRYNITVTTSGGTILFNGGQAGNADISSTDFSNVQGSYNVTLSDPTQGGTLTQTLLPYTDLNNNNSYDPGIDCPGNAITITYTVNVKPIINCSSDLTVNTDPGQCSAAVSYNVSAMGMPTPAINYNFSGATTGNGSGTGTGSIFNKGVTTVTITATNSCGTTTCTFTINVEDHENPLIGCSGGLTVANDAGKCGAKIILIAPTTHDNCPGVIITSNAPSDNFYPVGTTTVTWTATDASGNTATCTQTVTVTDNEKPTITCPQNVSVSNDPGQCGATVNLGTPIYGDNCSAGTHISNNAPANNSYSVGTTTVTWTVTDAAGNTATCTQTVTVTDNEKPVIHNVPADMSVPALGSNCSSGVITWTKPTATDNCQVASLVSNDPTYEQFGFTILGVGVHTITYTATDVHGNTSTATFTIRVVDDQAPIITGCPSNITTTVVTGQCGKRVSWNPPTASDNCPGVSLSTNHIPGEFFPAGTTTVTYTATDNSGNTTTCSFTVMVNDNEFPRITCPGNITHTADAGSCSYSGNTGAATATDNCGIQSIVGVRSDNQPMTTPYMVGTTTVTWTATDIHGNATSCTQIITITDDEKPIITCPGNITHTADAGSCSYSGNAGTATATDNCGVQSVNGVRSDNQPLTASYPVGTTTITWTATDIHGNTSICKQTVTITDNETPVISGCPSDVTVHTGAGHTTCSQTATWTAPTASDNCGIASTIPNHHPGDVFPVGTTSVSYTFTDIHGNISTCTFNVIVIDDTKPVISGCSSNITATATAGQCGKNVTWNAPVATDNCPGVSLVTNHNPGEFFSVGTTTVTYVATDHAGNTATCTFTVTITDNEPPHITCPASVTVSCAANVPAPDPTKVTASDNCGTVTVTFVSDVIGNQSSTKYTITRTWKATDAAGNTVTCTQQITVMQSSTPVITCPANTIVYVGANCTAITDPSHTGTPNTSANCGTVTVTYNDISSQDPYPWKKGYYNYIILRTWTVTNSTGNHVSCTQTIVVIDNTAPTITCPQPVTVNADLGKCTANVSAGTPTVTNGCGPVTVSSKRSDGASITSPFNGGVTTIIWTATDVSGNTATCTQTITVNDNQFPSVTCPYSGTVTKNADAKACTYKVYNAEFNATAKDNCGVTSLKYTLTGATTGTGTSLSGVTLNVGTTTITWKAVDGAGNAVTCSFTVNVVDNQVPVVGCPSALSLCSVSNNTYTITPVTVSDNCGVATVTYVIKAGSTVIRSGVGTNASGTFPSGNSTIYWTVKDIHNNTGTGTTAITVQTCKSSHRTETPDAPTLPAIFTLNSYPNPFGNATKIIYSLPVDSKVTIKVYDMLGREVNIVVDANKLAGEYSLDYNTSKLTSGVYYARMVAVSNGTEYVQSQKLIKVE